MSEDLNKLKELAEACPYKAWAAFTDESGPRPHTNLVSFTGKTECVLPLPGLHKKDALVAYLSAFNPATALSLLSRLQAAEERADERKARMAEIDDAIWSAMQSQAEDVRVNGDAHRPMLEILERLHEQSRAVLKTGA